MLNCLSDFDTAGREVLAFLRDRLGFNLWMITRTQGDDWIVLLAEDHKYNVEPGMVFRWTDSFCSEMIKGNGPRIAPCSESVPAYATAPIGRQIKINAYVGLPLVHEDGRLFGTLCAIDPSPQPTSIVEDLALLELLASLLSRILQAELRAVDATRRTEKLQVEAITDALTKIYNRRGWDKFLELEEERCRRYGNPAAVLIVDIDGLKLVNDSQGHAAGDQLIERAAAVLSQTARSLDIVARLGGDEFGILCVECDQNRGDELLKRIRAALAGAGINASIGIATRTPSSGLNGAWKSADQKMYAEKRLRELASI